MPIWALADLHLALGNPQKDMQVFGGAWIDYTKKIEAHWRSLIKNDDLILLPGDISWASTPQEAIPDLKWIDALPGTKVMIRGNHDYWWSSLKQVKNVLPPSIHLIQNSSFIWKGIGIAGSRLWDNPLYNFDPYIHFVENPKINPLHEEPQTAKEKEKIYQRELGRLESSLKSLPSHTKLRIGMTHYPPISADLKPSQATELLERYQIQCCVFGHIHSARKDLSLFGSYHGISYILTACDYLDCTPLLILE